MYEKYLLMKWKDIPLDEIHKAYQEKIVKSFEGRDPNEIVYGYPIHIWIEAFEAKKKMLEVRQLDNYKASIELQLIRKTKQFRTERAIYKLLLGICKGLRIEKL